MIVYLAGPIDDVDRGEASEWREYASRCLALVGHTCFSPSHAYPSGGRGQDLHTLNRAVIWHADFLIANLGTRRGLTFGTVREIEFASLCGARILAVTSEKIPSLLTYDVQQVETVDDAICLISRGGGEQHGTAAGSASPE